MKLSRNFSLKIAFVLDQILPPILRDFRGLNYLMARLVYGSAWPRFFSFKQDAPFMNLEQFSKAYRETGPFFIERETDLNSASVEQILKSIEGTTVLDVGCGSGYLLKQIARVHPAMQLNGADVNLRVESDLKIQFTKASVEELPFADHSFDTVICTHTLEHVLDLQAALKELRRVVKKRLILVVPMQRPYNFTFDFHLRFFPYPHSFLIELRPVSVDHLVQEVDGDLYYQETV